MRWTRLGVTLSATLVLAACGERTATTGVSAPASPSASVLPPAAAAATATCPTARSLAADVVALFARNDKIAAAAQLTAAMVVIGTTPVLNSPRAQKLVLGIISFVLKKYWAGQLNGGSSATTQQEVVDLVNGLLCWIGMPQSFTLASLGSDGTAAVITPTTPDTTLVTDTKTAGVKVDSGSVTQPVLVTIKRLPDSPGPLLTHLDQYPIFYEFSVTPDTGSFQLPVTVGVCLANDANPFPPDTSRLRVAHNVAPDTMGSIQILPRVPAPFLDCTNAQVIGAASANPFANLAMMGWRAIRPTLQSVFLPEAAYAAAGGIGGTAKTFSPFGLVDPVLEMTPNSPTSQNASAGTAVSAPPSVSVKTPLGNAYPGVPVVFARGQNPGALTDSVTSTDAGGLATVGSWTLGTTPGNYTVAATGTPPYPQVTIDGSPATFTATALGPTQLRFTQGPSTAAAGMPLSPTLQVSVEDQNGNVVTSSAAPVMLTLSGGSASLVGTTTVDAVNGVATFTGVTVNGVVGSYTLTATSTGLTSATISPFTLTAGAAAQIAINAINGGNNQTAREGTAVMGPLSVTVTDTWGNPVSGATVTFTPQLNNGTVTGGTQTTDGNGVATLPGGSWTLAGDAQNGPDIDTDYLDATVAPGISVTFTATGSEAREP